MVWNTLAQAGFQSQSIHSGNFLGDSYRRLRRPIGLRVELARCLWNDLPRPVARESLRERQECRLVVAPEPHPLVTHAIEIGCDQPKRFIHQREVDTFGGQDVRVNTQAEVVFHDQDWTAPSSLRCIVIFLRIASQESVVPVHHGH